MIRESQENFHKQNYAQYIGFQVINFDEYKIA